MKPRDWINIATGLGSFDHPLQQYADRKPTGRSARSAKETLDRMQGAEQKRRMRADKRRKAMSQP